MKNLLNCSSLIRVAVIIVVMAFMASQMTNTYAKDMKLDEHDTDIKASITQHDTDVNSDIAQHDTDIKGILNNTINPNILAHDGNMEAEYGALSAEHSDLDTKLDEIYAAVQNGNGTDCDDCPPPEGIEKSWVPKTGSTINNDAGEDGDLLKGVTWPNPRFTDNLNGTITDNLTCLIWTEDANCIGALNWSTALTACNSLASGSCGLTDGSVAGDWRLPNVRELFSLIDFSQFNPALPSGHPFDNEMEVYWTSTTYASNSTVALRVLLYDGKVDFDHKAAMTNPVWCVRGP